MKSTQKKRNVHGQRKKFASPNARDTNMLVFLALGNAKVLSFASGDAKLPNVNVFFVAVEYRLKGLTIIHVNTRSVFYKLDELKHSLTDFDTIVFTETWT